MKRTNKRVMTFLLSLLMVFGICFSAGIPDVKAAENNIRFTVNADKDTLHRGDTVNITVSMSGNVNARSLVYHLKYDAEKLEYVSHTPGQPIADAGMFGKVVHKADLSEVWATAMMEPVGNGNIMTITFKVKENAKGNVGISAAQIQVIEGLTELPYEQENHAENLNVEIAVTKITLDQSEINLKKGETAKLTAAVEPADAAAAVAWKSSNEGAVTVDQKGNVTAVGAGEAVITAEASGISASCKVNVAVPLDSISIKSEKDTVKRNETAQLSVVYVPTDTTDDKTITWSSSGEFAVVDGNGLVTAVKEGTETITAKAGGKTASCQIKVVENHLTEELAKTVRFEKIKEAVLKGQTINLMDYLNLSDIITENDITDDMKLVWETKDKDVVKVDSKTGEAKGLKEGKAKITVEITATGSDKENPVSASAEVEVEVKEIPLGSIAFDKIIKEMQVGSIETLKVICNPADTTDDITVEWSSSDTSVLSVENGVVKALKAGKATVTAKVGDKTANCEITVKDNETSKNPADTGNGKTETKTEKNTVKNAVKTGDTANVALYLILLAVAAAVILVSQRKRSRR